MRGERRFGELSQALEIVPSHNFSVTEARASPRTRGVPALAVQLGIAHNSRLAVAPLGRGPPLAVARARATSLRSSIPRTSTKQKSAYGAQLFVLWRCGELNPGPRNDPQLILQGVGHSFCFRRNVYGTLKITWRRTLFL